MQLVEFRFAADDAWYAGADEWGTNSRVNHGAHRLHVAVQAREQCVRRHTWFPQADQAQGVARWHAQYLWRLRQGLYSVPQAGPHYPHVPPSLF